MTGNLHSDYKRVGCLLGFPACSSTQWSRIAFPALFEHQEQFLQLVKKKKKMMIIIIIIIYNPFNIIVAIYSVTRLTGITQAMLRTEQPLSVVLLDWVDIAVAEVSESTCTNHFAGMTTVTICLVPFANITK